MADKEIKIKPQVDSSEVDKGTEAVKSYAAQLRAAKLDLISVEQQFGANSKQYKEAQKKVNDLREAQEELNRASKPLAERFKELGGPLGRLGGLVDEIGDKFSVLKGGLGQLGLGFKSVGQAIASTGIGLLVIILGGLIAAVVKAAKSFEPLQRATEKIGIAVDLFMQLLKPVTDFILNVVVGAMEGLAKAIAFVTGNLDEYNKKAADASATAALAKNLKQQEEWFDANGDKYDQYTQKKIKANLDFKKKTLEIDADETKSAKQKEALKVQYRQKADREIQAADDARAAEVAKADEAAAKQAASDAKQRTAEKLAQKKADLDAQIKLETDKADTSREKLKALLDKRMALELQDVKLSEAQKEVIRKDYAKKLEDALKEDADKKKKQRADELDALIQIEIEKADTNKEELKKLLDERMNLELEAENLTEAQKQVIRNKYKKQLEDALKVDADKKKQDAEKRKQDILKGFEDEFAAAGNSYSAQLQAYESFNNKLVTMTEFSEKEKAEIRAKYSAQILAGLDKTQQSELVMINSNIDAKKGKDKDYYDSVDKVYSDEQVKLKELLDKKVIDQETYNIKNDQLSQARNQTADAERTAQVTAWGQIGQALTQLGEIAGAETAAGKALALAGIAIDTAIAISGIVRQATKNPTNLTPFQLAADIALRSIMVLTNIAKAKSILSQAKIPPKTNAGGGGGAGAQAAPAAYTVSATRASGGLISGPGSSRSDSILARVSNGEYVVNANATSAFLPMLESMNDAGNQPQFAGGGLFMGRRKKLEEAKNMVEKSNMMNTGEIAPIKTYVTATDMSNQQQFNRTIKSRSLL